MLAGTPYDEREMAGIRRESTVAEVVFLDLVVPALDDHLGIELALPTDRDRLADALFGLAPVRGDVIGRLLRVGRQRIRPAQLARAVARARLRVHRHETLDEIRLAPRRLGRNPRGERRALVGIVIILRQRDRMGVPWRRG